jgi:hypothetical protein
MPSIPLPWREVTFRTPPDAERARKVAEGSIGAREG